MNNVCCQTSIFICQSFEYSCIATHKHHKRFGVAELWDDFTQFGTAFQLFQLPIHTAFIQRQRFDRT